MPTTDNNQYLTSIGVTVKVNNALVKGAISFGDIGGEPNTLDATKLTDSVRIYEMGVQDQGSWDVTYLFNNNATDSDYRTLQALADENPKVTWYDLEVDLPDGTKFTNKGKCSNRLTGAGVDAMLEAVATFVLKDKWTVTNPSTTT